jgi:hypothetical protein
LIFFSHEHCETAFFFASTRPFLYSNSLSAAAGFDRPAVTALLHIPLTALAAVAKPFPFSILPIVISAHVSFAFPYRILAVRNNCQHLHILGQGQKNLKHVRGFCVVV